MRLICLAGLYQLLCFGMWQLRILQESGGVSSWIVPVQCIILYSFSLHEFTLQVLIKVFNEVISTWDHMSYFLFSPPGFLGKYTRHIYCHPNSMDILHIELTEAIISICWIIFSLFSHRVWRSFINISYTTPHIFPIGFLEEILIEDDGRLWSQAVIRGSVRNNNPYGY